jgi:redox-sensitive bicupin YhaK (pirin superfamily)
VLAYVFEGEAEVAGKAVARGTLAVLGDEGSELSIAAGKEGAAVMFIAAAPIGEPIVRHGPFVMNTRKEIEQALEDYYRGRL